MATQLEELTKSTNEAQQAVTQQASIVEGLESSVTSLRAELNAAQQKIEAGQGTPEDLNVIGLNPAKIDAQGTALTKAREELAWRQHILAKRAARQWVEETLRDNPETLDERAAKIKADGEARMSKIHREVTEQLAALEDERANLEQTAKELSRAIEDRPAGESANAGLSLMYGKDLVGLDGTRLSLNHSMRDETFGADAGARMDHAHWSVGRKSSPITAPEWAASMGPEVPVWD